MSDDDARVYVVQLAAAAEQFARVAQDTGAPEGCAEWLQFLAEAMLAGAGITVQ